MTDYASSDALNQLNEINSFAEEVYHLNPANPDKTFMDLKNQDIKDFLKSLSDNKVRYMLVGGIATVFHGHVRTKQDIDIWIEDTEDNRTNLVKSLKSIGVPGAENYKNLDMVPGWSSITIGKKGFVADFMGYLKKYDRDQFDSCYKRSVTSTFDGIPLRVISREDLIAEKKEVGRHKGLDDVENLEKLKRKGGK